MPQTVITGQEFNIVVMTEEFDTATSTGRLMLTLLSGFAAHERERACAGNAVLLVLKLTRRRSIPENSVFIGFP